MPKSETEPPTDPTPMPSSGPVVTTISDGNNTDFSLSTHPATASGNGYIIGSNNAASVSDDD